MASSNSEKIDSIVDKKVLDELSALDKALDNTSSHFVSLLQNVDKVESKLSKASISYSKLVDAISKYETIINQLTPAEREAQRLMGERDRLRQRAIQSTSQEAREIIALREQINRNNREIRNQVREQQSANNSIDQMKAKLAQLRAEYNALSSEARRSDFGRNLRSQIDELSTSVDRASGKKGIWERLFGGAGSIAASFGLVGGIQAVVGAVKYGTGAIRDFELANTTLAGILGENIKDIKELTDSAINLGRKTKYTASQVTELQTELAKLGFSRQGILEAQKDVLNFATALEANLSDAAELSGASLRAFGADTKETNRYLNTMVLAANKSAISFEYLATAMPIIAPVAKAFNFSIEDTLALLGKLSDAGFDASMGATALRNIFLNLADTNGKLSKSLSTPVTDLESLVKGFQELRDKGVNLNETLQLTDKRSVAAFNAFLTAADGLVPLRDGLKTTGGEMEDLAEQKMQTLDGATLELKSSWEALVLSFRNSTGPMASVVRGLTNIISKVNEGILAMQGIENTYAYQDKMKEFNKQLTADYNAKLGKAYFEKDSTQKDEEFFADFYKKQKDAAEKSIKEQEKLVEEFEKTRLTASQRFFEMYGLAKDEAYKEELNRMKIELGAKKEQLKAISSIEENHYKESERIRKAEAAAEAEKLAKEREAKAAADAAAKVAEPERKRRAEAESKAVKDIAEFEAKQIVQSNKEIVTDTKNSYEERLSALDAYVQSQKDSIELSKKNQLDNSKLTASQIELINLKANAEIAKVDEESEKLRLSITKKYTEERIKQINKEVSASADTIGAKEKADLADLAERYNAGNGSMKAEQYEYERTEITRKATMERYEIQVQAAKDALEIEGLTLEQRESLEQNLGKARIDYENYVNETIVQNEEKAAKAREQIEQQLADKRKEIIGDALNFIGSLYNSQFERQLQNLKAEEDANKEQSQKQKEQIQENVEFGKITKEEAYIQQETMDRVAEEREEALAEKRRTIQNKQAKMERAMALAGIIQETASSILKIKAQAAVLLSNPFTAAYAAVALAQIPLVVASSAAQTAAILATPLPQYKHGTLDHKGGAAIVGDGGKHELGILPDGSYFKTPNRPTVMDLPKHTVIMPDYEKAIEQISVTNQIAKPSDSGPIVIQENKRQLDMMKKQTQEVAALHKTLRAGLAYRPVTSGIGWR